MFHTKVFDFFQLLFFIAVEPILDPLKELWDWLIPGIQGRSLAD